MNPIAQALQAIEKRLAHALPDANSVDVEEALVIVRKVLGRLIARPTAAYRSTTHEERWLHVRFPDGDPKAVTAFIRKEDDGVWYYHVGCCHPIDPFSREAGRNYSRRRYFVLRDGGDAQLEAPLLTSDSPGYDAAYAPQIDFVALREIIQKNHAEGLYRNIEPL